MKVDPFISLLILALALLLVFSLLSGTFIVQQQPQPLATFSLGTVGFAQDVVFQSLQLGEVRVGETQEELVRQVLELQVSQGLFGGQSQSLEVNVDPAFLELSRGAKVGFSVLEANPLGNLRITWNGKEFYNARPSGLTEFTIPTDYVKGENTLTLAADGPGLQFWATTSYRIRNLRVYALVGPQKVVPFSLLPSELQAFERGEVSFFGSGTGTLTVAINRFPLFSRQPAGPEKVTFNLSSAPLKAGPNVLSFSSAGSNVLSGAALKLYGISGEVVKSRSFTLTKEELSAISSKRGRIDVVVDEIIKPGVLSISLNDQRLDIQSIRLGNNTIPYAAADLVEGANQLGFSGTGAWEISEVVVGVE